MSLATVGLAAWAARRHVLAGVLLGLGIATKFYPLVFFGPLLLLCLRAGRMRAFWVTAGSAAAAWLVVNLPVMIAAPAGWDYFYWLSDHRGADWGSIWYFFGYLRWPLLGTTSVATLNLLSLAAFCLACAGIVVLALAAPRRPRLPQLLFLVLGAVPVDEQGVVAAVRHLAGAARRARPAQDLVLRAVAGGRDRLLLRDLGLPDHPAWAAARAASARISTSPRCWPGSPRCCCCAGSWSGTSCGRTRTWSARAAPTTRRAVCCRARRTASCCGCGRAAWSGRGKPDGRRSAGEPLPEPADVARRVRRLADRRGPGGADHVEQQSRIDRPVLDAGVPVPARSPNSSRELLQCTRSIRPVMALTRSTMPASSSPPAYAWQVSRQKPTLSSSPAGDRLPEPGHRVQAAGHRAVAARGVLDQHRHRALDPLDRLAPVVVPLARVGARVDVAAVHDHAPRADGGGGLQLLAEQLAAGDPDPVVGGRHVDAVRSVDEDVDAAPRRTRRAARPGSPGKVGAFQPCGSPRKNWATSASQEVARGERVAAVHVGPDPRHPPSLEASGAPCAAAGRPAPPPRGGGRCASTDRGGQACAIGRSGNGGLAAAAGQSRSRRARSRGPRRRTRRSARSR